MTRAGPPSYWEATLGDARPDWPALAGDACCDVAIIGGGFTGLSAALHLARDHGIDARVLEAGPIAWGASGRNAGFCLLAATKLSIAQMLRRYGQAETQRFYAAQREGIELVRELCASEGIDCERRGEGTLTVAHVPGRLDELRREADTLTRLLGIPARVYTRAEFRALAHDGTEQHGGLHTGTGFALHPLKLALGIARAAERHGATLHGHSGVRDWRREGAAHMLHTAGGRLRARRVIVATNGYYPDGLHPRLDGRTLPALSNIIVTRPLDADELACQRYRAAEPICNTRTLLFYYRLLPDGRFLFGARGDTTGRPADGVRMRAWMERRLGEVFPAWRGVAVDYFWRGLVCVTRRLAPSIGRLEDDPTVWYGFGYHANGVNTAPWTGMRLARAVAGGLDADAVAPLAMRGLPARFPLPALRLWALRGAYLWYRLQDRG
ncbi:MAG: FAD-dependent oxidoreductase [Halofilum sp. (in: g-proteobacteria)]|nr:FAD-dependent oxidoreductase [Halofilum sp. (in: g-proteobacteria)]